jgi:hypothetical protein
MAMEKDGQWARDFNVIEQHSANSRNFEFLRNICQSIPLFIASRRVLGARQSKSA